MLDDVLLNIVDEPIMLSVVMLNAVMLNVTASFKTMDKMRFEIKFDEIKEALK